VYFAFRVVVSVVHVNAYTMRETYQVSRTRRLLQNVFLASLLTCGACARFRQVGTRTVEHRPERIGPVSETLVRYHPPEIKSTPTSSNPQLKVLCEKDIRTKIQYRAESHEERVLQREVSSLQSALEDISEAPDSLRVTAAILNLPFEVIYTVVGLSPGMHTETEYEPIPRSEGYRTTYDYEESTVPASGVRLSSNDLGSCVTNELGTATLSGAADKYDSGIRLTHIGSRKTYIIRRTKHERQVTNKAPWRDEALLTSNVAGAALTAWRAKNIVAVGGGPAAVAGAVLVDVITGLAIGYVIDIAATETGIEYYYRWSILPDK